MKKTFLLVGALVLGTLLCLIGFYFSPKNLDNPLDNYFERVKKAADWLKTKTGDAHPMLMISLTGGVDVPDKLLTDKQEILSSEIPYFPKARVEGHEGRLIFGKLNGKDMVILKGRFHYYEGNSPQEVVFPYFVLHELGVKSLIITNAVGGIRNDLDAGQIMLISDHINYAGQDPLRGLAIQQKHDQFPDMTNVYDRGYQSLARQIAHELSLDLSQGVYIMTVGPSYETKAEVRAFRQLGADVVGMSTVFEVIACNFLGIKVLAFSTITNPAADRHVGPMNHTEVLAAMAATAPRLSQLISECARRILAL